VPVRRVCSGGQTGVDRAALDAALAVGLPIGGWCPRGGWAEDGTDVRVAYPQLQETPSEDPGERTRWNVRDSGATLVLTRSDATSPGTDLALEAARELGRPFRVVHLDGSRATEEVWDFLRGFEHELDLSVGGPRESQAPGIYATARALLEAVLPQFRVQRRE
jgi:hypothetical protein